ncbi:unnamed protein product [Rotaria sordida]|uniref:Uncharacterized protein n=1 Tax=Rotaria sordida TaxID=392033 RepID=A0A815F1S4_9BILA|nr:unnamed protein product [Rotaria sordida]CAF1451337.1 unnamed protein product [Rotaria sordida]CAF1472315.1 unnamed protein product [Rotaria sordida]CAF3850843.1 unnamed protein product [Rotaria sordida]
MAPLSHDLAGLNLPHDHFGSHLNESGVTINIELEKLNFQAKGGHEFRVRASNEYYQENARVPQEKFGEQPKYDIDEYWRAIHVLQTQYTLQIIRCNSIECCGSWRSNYNEVFPHRFLPAPVPFERTPYGIRMAERDY